MKTFAEKLQATKSIDEGLSYYKHGDVLLDTTYSVIKQNGIFSPIPSQTRDEIVTKVQRRLNLRMLTLLSEEIDHEDYLISKKEIMDHIDPCFDSLVAGQCVLVTEESGVKKYGPVKG